MRKSLWTVVLAVALSLVVLAGCQSTPAAPTAAPTSAPAAAPTKAPAGDPTKAPAQTAAPATQPPAAKTPFPEKGKTMKWIEPFSAGGPLDLLARLMAPVMEKELGTFITVEPKPGAGGQLGMTELYKTKPDGYSFAWVPLPMLPSLYLDPDRQTAFSAKDFQALALHHVDPCVVAVKADSPFKTMKDFIDAAKANPEKVKVGDSGLMSDDHFAAMLLEKQAGVKFASVHFEGSAPERTALLGGHIDVAIENVGAFLPMVKADQVRILGILDTEENKFLPGVKTAEAQGYKVYMSSARTLMMPAPADKAVVDVLVNSFKKASETDEVKKKMEEIGLVLRFQGPDAATKFWKDMEADVKPLIEMSKKK